MEANEAIYVPHKMDQNCVKNKSVIDIRSLSDPCGCFYILLTIGGDGNLLGQLCSLSNGPRYKEQIGNRHFCCVSNCYVFFDIFEYPWYPCCRCDSPPLQVL